LRRSFHRDFGAGVVDFRPQSLIAVADSFRTPQGQFCQRFGGTPQRLLKNERRDDTGDESSGDHGRNGKEQSRHEFSPGAVFRCKRRGIDVAERISGSSRLWLGETRQIQLP
jgi:hypothetical protein